MSHKNATCRVTDEIHAALKIMKVRRLPILNEEGKLEGIRCMSDLFLDARHKDGSRPSLSYEDVMGALKSIYTGIVRRSKLRHARSFVGPPATCAKTCTPRRPCTSTAMALSAGFCSAR